MPKCPECDRSFTSAHGLRIHTGRAHGESKPAKRGKRAAPATGPNLARISTPDIVAELSRRAVSLDKVRSIIAG